MGRNELKEVLRLLEVFETVRSQVAQRGDFEQGAPREVEGRLGEQDLSAVSRIEETRHPVERRTEVVAVPAFPRSRVDCHPNSQRAAPGVAALLAPALGVQRSLGGQSRSDGIRRDVKGGTELVAHALKDVSAVCSDSLKKEGVVASEGEAHRLGMLLP